MHATGRGRVIGHHQPPANPHRAAGARADEFRFRGGRLSLDFTATLAGRLRRRLERLAEPADLGPWFVSLRKVLDGGPEVRAPELVAARQLREAIAAWSALPLPAVPWSWSRPTWRRPTGGPRAPVCACGWVVTHGQ